MNFKKRILAGASALAMLFGSAAVMRIGADTLPFLIPTIFVVEMPTSIPMTIPIIVNDFQSSMFNVQ